MLLAAVAALQPTTDDDDGANAARYDSGQSVSCRRVRRTPRRQAGRLAGCSERRNDGDGGPPAGRPVVCCAAAPVGGATDE